VPPTIDVGDPRILAAENEIEKLIGARLAFELDRTLIPAFGNGLHAAFVAALESTVTQLEYCKDAHPTAFEFGRTHFKTLRWTYTATRNPPAPTLDPPSGVFSVAVPSDQHMLLQEYTITETFKDALEHEYMRLYEPMDPAKVPPGEQEAYFDYQRTYHRFLKGPDGRQLPGEDQTRLKNILILFPAVKDPKLRADVREWLGYQGGDLRRALRDSKNDPVVQRIARDVRPRYISWINQYHREFTAEDRKRITDLFFSNRDPEPDGFDVGFDVTTYSLPAVRSWIAQQAKAEPSERMDPADSMIVCPYREEYVGDYFRIGSYCNGYLYTALFGTKNGPKKLAQLLTSQHEELFTQSATLHILAHLGSKATEQLLDALNKDDAAFRAAIRGLSDYAWDARAQLDEHDPKAAEPDTFLQRIPEWWKAYPSRRGDLLELLTRLSKRYEGTVVWPDLATYLGTRIGASELSDFIDQNPRSVWAMRLFKNALSDGWSRSELMLPKLQTWFDRYNRSQGEFSDPRYMTGQLIDFFCAAGTRADIKATQAFLKKRIEAFPDEANQIENYVDQRPSELCPDMSDEPARKPKPRLFDE
jgi:hypothetical protein